MTVPADEYCQVIGHFPTGVTVITSQVGGERAGMTASAVASLSLDPVLLVVCVRSSLPSHDVIERAGRFAVNVLGEGQEMLAKQFATRMPDKFGGLQLKPGFDPPVLRDAIAWLVCRVWEQVPGGDHSLFVGEVERCGYLSDRKPLLYWDSQFWRLDSDGAPARRKPEDSAGESAPLEPAHAGGQGRHDAGTL